MDPANSERDPFEELAEEFLERYRRGERPSVQDYATRHPDLAERICRLFPTLLVMEKVRPGPLEPVERVERPRADLRLERLGDYRILRELGRGGMGIVYEAEQESLGRHVALKVLAGHTVLDARHLERFRREAKTAARLHHTNIVPVHGIGEQDGLHYIVMQFIQGLGLDEVLSELRGLRQGKPGQVPTAEAHGTSQVAQSLLSGTFDGPAQPSPQDNRPAAPEDSGRSSTIHLPGQAHGSSLSESGWQYWRSIARIGLQVAGALAYAHGQGILHRDIKPSNLVLDTRGTVWITDFGLAKGTDDTDNLTHTGDMVGTMRYMAPERFQGKGDIRSDVYALGLTLYELLTLRPAFGAANRDQLIAQVLHDEPQRPRRIDSHIPRDLETIVLKAAARDPAHRYLTPSELADDLQRFLDDRPITARQLGPLRRGWRWCRRNPSVASLVGAVALLLVAVTAGSWVALWRLQHEQQQTVQQLQRAEKAEQDSKDRLWESYLAQAHALRWSGQPGRHYRSLDALRAAAAIRPSPELRNEAAACIPLVDVRPARRWDWTGIKYVAFDPALARYAFLDKGAITFYRLTDDREVLHFPAVGAAHEIRFSADGKYMLVAIDPHGMHQMHQIWRLDPPQKLFEVRLTHGCGIRPDGRELAVNTGKGTIQFHELPSGRPARELPLGKGNLGVAYHPQGHQLAVFDWDADTTVRLVEADSGKLVHTLRHPRIVYRPAWTCDGNVLAVPCADHRIYLWDARTGTRLMVLEGHQNTPVRCAFNHQGDLLASYGYDGATRLWDPYSGKELVSIRGEFYCFSPDDRYLAYWAGRGGEAGLWEIARSPECRMIRAAQAAGGAYPDISPCGRWLALIDAAGTRLFDQTTRQEVALVPTGSNGRVRFCRGDGSLVAVNDKAVYRWPMALDAAGATLRVGPPQRLCALPGSHHDITPDGRWARALLDAEQFVVINLERPAQPLRVKSHRGAELIALSPDGRWLAAGTRHEAGIQVWDMATGQVVHKTAAGHWAYPLFSPDSQWLATSWEGGETQLWEVGTWRLKHRWSYPLFVPGQAFSWDGTVMAIRHTRNTLITLVDVASGAELVTLSPPQTPLLGDMCFGRDGQTLMVGCGAAIQVWDLRALRTRLRAMGLDWDPPLPAAPPAESSPLRVEVVTGSPGR
jgi:serine/threonine protein kinase/WD40 repeat protein